MGEDRDLPEINAEKPEKAVPGTANRERVKSGSGTEWLVEKLKSRETRAWLLSSFPWLQKLWKHLCWQEGSRNRQLFPVSGSGVHCGRVLLPTNGHLQEAGPNHLPSPMGVEIRRQQKTANILFHLYFNNRIKTEP